MLLAKFVVSRKPSLLLPWYPILIDISMFKFKSSLKLINFQKNAYIRRLQERLEVIQREAARAWLRAVLEHVPTWTGTARGTYLSLGSVLRVAVPIKPIVTRPNRGPIFGTVKSYFDFSAEGLVYRFSFTQNLEYYLMDELNIVPNIPSTPWFSFSYGENAWMIEVKNRLHTDLPQIASFVSFRKV